MTPIPNAATPAAADSDLRPPVHYRPRGNEVERATCYLNRPDPLMLVGPTGCGKTTLVTDLAAQRGQRLVTVAGDVSLSVHDLVGRWHLTATGSDWRDGPLTEAVKSGAVFYLDEITSVPEDVLKAIFPLLDHRRTLIVPSLPATFVAAPAFRFVASYNPGYATAGPEFSPAFRERFRVVALDYLEGLEETRLVVEVTGIRQRTAERLVKVAALTRDRFSNTLREGTSTRLLLMAADAIVDGIAFEDAVRDCLVAPLTDDPALTGAMLDALKLAGLLAPVSEPEPKGHAPQSPRGRFRFGK